MCNIPSFSHAASGGTLGKDGVEGARGTECTDTASAGRHDRTLGRELAVYSACRTKNSKVRIIALDYRGACQLWPLPDVALLL